MSETKIYLASEAVQEIKRKIEKQPVHRDNIKPLIEYSIGIWVNCFTVKTNWETLVYIRDKYRDQTKLENIIINLSAINSIYNTQRSNSDLKILAESILNKKLDLNNKKSIGYFDDILREYRSNNYDKPTPRSLLSKYFSVQNPNNFAINDSFARKSINYFAPVLKFRKVYAQTSYEKYIFSIDFILNELKLNYSYRDFDKFLWLYGQAIK